MQDSYRGCCYEVMWLGIYVYGRAILRCAASMMGTWFAAFTYYDDGHMIGYLFLAQLISAAAQYNIVLPGVWFSIVPFTPHAV